MKTTAERIAALQAEAQIEARSMARDIIARTKQLAADAASLNGMPLPPGVIETSRVLAQQADAAASRMTAVMGR